VAPGDTLAVAVAGCTLPSRTKRSVTTAGADPVLVTTTVAEPNSGPVLPRRLPVLSISVCVLPGLIVSALVRVVPAEPSANPKCVVRTARGLNALLPTLFRPTVVAAWPLDPKATNNAT
jgi:hypothetical protein